MTGRLPRRIRGEGWEVWVDPDGVLWTRDTRPMDAARAEVRVESMERFIRRRPVRGVLIDDRKPAGTDEPGASEVYARFVAGHPALPIAVVTRDPQAYEAALAARSGEAPGRLVVFGTIEAARRWLLGEAA